MLAGTTSATCRVSAKTLVGSFENRLELGGKCWRDYMAERSRKREVRVRLLVASQEVKAQKQCLANLVAVFERQRRMPVELHANPTDEGSSPSASRKSGVAQWQSIGMFHKFLSPPS